MNKKSIVKNSEPTIHGVMVSIEDLVLMTHKGFEELRNTMDERFNDVDKRFNGVNQRFNGIEGDISYLKDRVSEISRTLERHEEILEEHSEEFKLIHAALDALINPKSPKRIVFYKDFAELESRVSSLERKVAAGIKK